MREWFAYLPFLVGVRIFGALPEAVARNVGLMLGSLAARTKKKGRPLLSRHMRRVMGSAASDREIDAAVDGMFRSYGRYWAETLWFKAHRRDFILANTERINFRPVDEAIAAHRGIVFAVPHIGNWEIAGVVANDLGLDLMAVAEDLPNKRITDWFLGVRAQFGIHVVLTTDPSLRSKMVKLLRSGGALALLADRDVTGNGIPVMFFGEMTTMPAGPTVLAELTDSALIPVAVYFKEGAGYRIEVGDTIVIPDAETRSERIALGVQLVADVLEAQIRKEPSQWHLFQPNWPSDADVGGASGQ